MKKPKIIIFFLILTLFSFSPIFSKKAQAQWFDVNFLAKEIIAEPIINGLVIPMVVQSITDSTVNWINNGFQGNPAFVTDPGQFFGSMADGLAGQIIFNNPDLAFMCGPLRAKVQIAITQSYANRGRPYFQCTLSKVGDNFEGFIDDFSQGGWDGFIEMTQNSQNNPLGLYNSWNDQVISSINTKISQQQNELNQGRGFLTFKKCLQYAPDTQPTTIPVFGPDGTQTGSQTFPGQKGPCLEEETKTPGSVIEGQLNNVLGTGVARLQAADEIDEVITALFNQLISKTLGAAGLR